MCILIQVLSWLAPWTSSAVAPPDYPWIAGSYSGHESYVMEVSDNQLGDKTLTGSGSTTTVITQSGNHITYKAVDPLSGKFLATRTGTLTGNDLSISGPAAVAAPGISLTKNVFTATGTVEEGRIVIHGTGTIIARRGSQVETIQITSTATLTGDVSPLDVGRIQVEVTPSNGGRVSGLNRNGVYPTGTQVTLAASRSRGFYLVNWKEDDTVLGTGPTLQVTARGSRRIKAVFASVGSAGYAGLFQSGALPGIQSVGFLGATLSSQSSFSGTLRVLGKSHSIAGDFDAGWDFKRTLSRPGQSSLLVSLHLDPASRELSGSIKTADDAFSASLSMLPLPVYSRTSPSPLAGRFTSFLLPPGGSSDPQVPQGRGFLTISLPQSGPATLSGRLADGTDITASTPPGPDDSLPVHSFLFVRGTNYGGFFGTIGLHGTGAADDTCDGSLQTVKPRQSSPGAYADGFDAVTTVQGARYTAPPKNVKAVDVISAGISGGGIGTAQNLQESISVSSSNQVSVTSPNPGRLKITFNASAGSFSGSFMHPGSGRTTSFKGLLCQYPGNPQAAGFFLGPVIGGTGTSGPVLLQSK